MLVTSNIDYFNVHKTTLTKPSFKGWINQTTFEKTIDTFTRTSVVENKVELLYQKMVKSLTKVEPETIEAIVNRLSLKYSKEDVLEVMQAVSTFSSMKSFDSLRNEFAEREVKSFYSFIKGEPSGKYYKTKNQYRITSPFDKAKLITLNEVFNYFYTNVSPKFRRVPIPLNPSMILDSETLSNLESLSKRRLKSFNDHKFFIVKNLENSFNIFNQHKGFEDFVEEKLDEVYDLKKNQPSKSISELIDNNLNGETLKRAKKLGITPVIIELPKPEEITPKVIAENLSSIVPDKEIFKNLIEKALNKISHFGFRKEMALDMLQDKMHVYTFKSMANKLQKLKAYIEEEVKKNGKDVEKIYYNVLSLKKSFSVINYMYQKNNEIDPSRYIYCEIDRSFMFVDDLYNEMGHYLPKGATLVIIDDAIISGQSLFSYPFYYSPNRKVGDFDMIFASLYSTDSAKKNFLKCKYGKENNDKIVSVDYEINKADFIKRILIGDTSVKKRPLIMFPYMAPDNNAREIEEVLELFFPKGRFVKPCWYANF